jgi:cell division protein FtsB
LLAKENADTTAIALSYQLIVQDDRQKDIANYQTTIKQSEAGRDQLRQDIDQMNVQWHQREQAWE